MHSGTAGVALARCDSAVSSPISSPRAASSCVPCILIRNPYAMDKCVPVHTITHCSCTHYGMGTGVYLDLVPIERSQSRDQDRGEEIRGQVQESACSRPDLPLRPSIVCLHSRQCTTAHGSRTRRIAHGMLARSNSLSSANVNKRRGENRTHYRAVTRGDHLERKPIYLK